MNVDLTRTISLLELLWTTAAVVGLLVHTVNGLAAHGDLRRLRQSGLNSIRTMIARDNQRTEWVLWCVLLVYGIAGVLAMLRLPPPRPSGAAALAAFVPYLFLLSEVLLVWSSIMRRRTRQQVIQMLEARRATQ